MTQGDETDGDFHWSGTSVTSEMGLWEACLISTQKGLDTHSSCSQTLCHSLATFDMEWPGGSLAHQNELN